jgi:hypothetical protein
LLSCAERAGTINAIRGHMAEFGIVAAQRSGLKDLLTVVSDVDNRRLPSLARELLALQVEYLRAIEARIAMVDGRLTRQVVKLPRPSAASCCCQGAGWSSAALPGPLASIILSKTMSATQAPSPTCT